MSGMMAQVRNAIMQPLKTAVLRRTFHGRIAGPRVTFRTVTTGKTPKNVAMNIFHRGGGLDERNHASSPCNSRWTRSPSVNVLTFASQALNIADSKNASRAFSSANVRRRPNSREFEPGGGVSMSAPKTPSWENDFWKKSSKAFWNSPSRPIFNTTSDHDVNWHKSASPVKDLNNVTGDGRLLFIMITIIFPVFNLIDSQ